MGATGKLLQEFRERDYLLDIHREDKEILNQMLYLRDLTPHRNTNQKSPQNENHRKTTRGKKIA